MNPDCRIRDIDTELRDAQRTLADRQEAVAYWQRLVESLEAEKRQMEMNKPLTISLTFTRKEWNLLQANCQSILDTGRLEHNTFQEYGSLQFRIGQALNKS
jgi:hypothetical protein